MLDWDRLRIFNAAAQAGSFTRAGEVLRLSQSAVSRQISALEESVKLPLFHRHARGLVLTEQGEILYKAVQEVYLRLSAAENAITDSRDRPKGPLKVTCAVTVGTVWFTPKLGEFSEIYPEIQISILLDDKELDLSLREADIALRFEKPHQPDLIYKHLTTFKNYVYASKSYIERNSLPASEQDLDKHMIVMFGEDYRPPFAGINWLATAGVGRGQGVGNRSYFRINGLLAMLKAVEAGIGIAALPEYMAKDNQNLVRILPEMQGPVTDLFFVYPTELRNSKRVKVFKDYIFRHISDQG